jgi:hypothetical protein
VALDSVNSKLVTELGIWKIKKVREKIVKITEIHSELTMPPGSRQSIAFVQESIPALNVNIIR